MLHALMTLAAAEPEKSKTAFYVAGGVLAAAAFGVSAIAIRAGGFAEDKNTSRAVMALFALLVVAAMAMAVVTG
jgi:hypothetical protein